MLRNAIASQIESVLESCRGKPRSGCPLLWLPLSRKLNGVGTGALPLQWRSMCYDNECRCYSLSGDRVMSLVLKQEKPPLTEDETGAIRVGSSRVLLELIVRAFEDGATPETIVDRYSTVSLADVYATIGYYLNHKEDIENYLDRREELAESVRQHLAVSGFQADTNAIRSRLLARKAKL